MPAPSVAPTGWFIPTGQPTAFRRQSFGRSIDRKSTRLNSSHSQISYAVFCLKKKKKNHVVELEINNKKYVLAVHIVSLRSKFIAMSFLDNITGPGTVWCHVTAI